MTDIDKLKLAEYVTALQNGDNDAFKKIYNVTYQTVRFTVLKIVKNEVDTEDVMQESYLRMLDKINTLDKPESFMSWFNMMVANEAKNFLRKESKYVVIGGTDEDGEDDGSAKDFFESIEDDDEMFSPPDSEIEKEQLCETVMGFIDNLSEDRRTAIILYYYNDMTTKQIAKSLGTNENTIKSRIFKAKQQLAEEIGAYQKKFGKLLGIAPMSLVRWTVNFSSAKEQSNVPDFKSFFASANLPDVSSVSQNIGKVSNGNSEFFRNIITKISGLFNGNADPKSVVAAVVTVGVAVGGVAAGTTVMKNNSDKEKTQPETSLVVSTEVTPIIEAPSFEFNEKKEVDNEIEVKELKYGTKGTFQAFYNNGEIVNTRTLLDRKNFKASYEELLPAAEENRSKYSPEINSILEYINSSEGKSYTLDSVLTQQANVRAEEIAWSARDYSIRPDGTEYTTIFEHNGMTSGARNEIIAYRCKNTDEAFGVLGSEDNLNKLLDNSIQKIGIGVAQEPESEELVFVIHTYSDIESVNGLFSNFGDRIRYRRDSALDNTIDNLSETVSDLNEFEEKVADIPVIGDILLYDFSTDKFEMRARENLEKILDKLEDIGEN